MGDNYYTDDAIGSSPRKGEGCSIPCDISKSTSSSVAYQWCHNETIELFTASTTERKSWILPESECGIIPIADNMSKRSTILYNSHCNQPNLCVYHYPPFSRDEDAHKFERTEIVPLLVGAKGMWTSRDILVVLTEHAIEARVVRPVEATERVGCHSLHFVANLTYPIATSLPVLRPTVQQIAVGAMHWLVLTDCGQVFAAGSGSHGELGVGTAIGWSNQLLHIQSYCVNSSRRQICSSQERKASYISAGHSYSAILAAGDSGINDVFTFGGAIYYRLGNASASEDCFLPTIVSLLNTKSDDDCDSEDDYGQNCCYQGVKLVACGYWHTVVVTKGFNDVYAWGWNKFGQVHPVIEDNELIIFPRRIEALDDGRLVGEDEIVQITCGVRHTALLVRQATDSNRPGSINSDGSIGNVRVIVLGKLSLFESEYDSKMRVFFATNRDKDECDNSSNCYDKSNDEPAFLTLRKRKHQATVNDQEFYGRSQSQCNIGITNTAQDNNSVAKPIDTFPSDNQLHVVEMIRCKGKGAIVGINSNHWDFSILVGYATD